MTDRSAATPQPAATGQGVSPFAAAVYVPKKSDRTPLARFVEKLKAENVNVRGILQEEFIDENGVRQGIDAVDIATNHRIPIKRPVRDAKTCGLDVAALTETTGLIREAIAAKPDLMVIEKFGDQEQTGKGICDEILETIANGIPLLICVPEPALAIWQERSGAMGAVLPFTQEAFDAWWNSLNI